MTEPIDVRNRMTDGGVGRSPLDPAQVIGIAIHHSVTTSYTRASVEQEIDHLLSIDRYHSGQGWGGIGYHLAVFPSGRYYLCGSLDGARAHVAFRNHELIGIVLIGDFSTQPPPLLQLDAGAQAVAFVRRTYPDRPIKGHRDWALPQYPTACPGGTYKSWLSYLNGPPAKEQDMIYLVQRRSTGHIYAVGPDGRRWYVVSPDHLAALKQIFSLPDPGYVVLDDNVIDAIPEGTAAR